MGPDLRDCREHPASRETPGPRETRDPRVSRAPRVSAFPAPSGHPEELARTELWAEPVTLDHKDLQEVSVPQAPPDSRVR